MTVAQRVYGFTMLGTKRVLFLDFDGVLHPEGSEVDLPFCRLPLLEAWLRRRTNVDVVVSSSWREAHPLHELRGFFAEDLRTRIVDVTPQLRRDEWPQVDLHAPGEAVHQRHIEVLRWLAGVGEPRSWAALDDQADLYRPGTREVVLCDATVGLTAAQLGELDLVLDLVLDQ